MFVVLSIYKADVRTVLYYMNVLTGRVQHQVPWVKVETGPHHVMSDPTSATLPVTSWQHNMVGSMASLLFNYRHVDLLSNTLVASVIPRWVWANFHYKDKGFLFTASRNFRVDFLNPASECQDGFVSCAI